MQDILQEGNVVFRSRSLQVQYQAVSDGIGLALLHGFIAAENKNLEVILPKKIFATREYWMVVHEDLHQLSRIKAVSSFFTEVIKKEQGRLMNISISNMQL